MEVDHEIISMAVFPILSIQEGPLSVADESTGSCYRVRTGLKSI